MLTKAGKDRLLMWVESTRRDLIDLRDELKGGKDPKSIKRHQACQQAYEAAMKAALDPYQRETGIEPPCWTC